MMPMFFVNLLGSVVGRVAVGVIGGLLLLLGFWGWLKIHDHKIYNEGYSAALVAVDKQDERSVNAKNRNAKKIIDCRAAGREWYVPDGVCRDIE